MTSRDLATKVLAEALVMNASDVDDSTALGVTPQWDSLAHMRIILSIEKRINSRLGAEAIVSIASLSDVIAVLQEIGPPE